MEGISEEGEDVFSVVCGDLGLGESARSRNYLELEHLRMLSEQSSSHRASPAGSKSSLVLQAPEFHGRLFIPGLSNSFSSTSDPLLYDDGSVILSCQSSVCGAVSDRGAMTPACDSDQQHEAFATYADVPYGTSLRQHKKLFEQEVENLRRQHSDSVQSLQDTCKQQESKKSKESRKKRSFRFSGKEISSKLTEAMTEMEELKLELDACRRRLDAKYQAVAILREQAECADAELKNTERRANETSRRLEQEVNKLQFELEWKESSFIDSQQTWAERFDRVCQENTVLMSKLEARNEELRLANAHKAALSRERDELLALVDVAERLKYEQGKSKIAEDEYGSFSSSELAVLGACKCRLSSPEPCGCAHAAANLRKEVAKLRDEGDWLQQRWEECSLTVDAYRSAFEEQLSKSRKLSQRLSQIATLSSRSAKAKAAIKWLIQVMNDDEVDTLSNPLESRKSSEKGNSLSNMSLQELVTVLTDMISEKNEALAHQKLAAQVLADKLERLQGRAESIPGSSTREVGVQSPSLSRMQKPQRVSTGPDLYQYDELFELSHSDLDTTHPVGVAKLPLSSLPDPGRVVVEKETTNADLVLELCDQEVSNECDSHQGNSLSLSDGEEDSSATPFVSADDGEEDEMIKQVISTGREKE